VRRRKLPAEYVAWIVTGMGLLRDRSIQEVVHHLALVVPGLNPPHARQTVTGGAVVQACDRLGDQALQTLFTLSADHWASASAQKHRWRGLRVFGADGSRLRIPNTTENDSAFGRAKSGRGWTGYPQLRMVALMVLRSHLLAGLTLGGCHDSELTLAASLWPKLPDSSLTILDRGFISYLLFHQLQTSGCNRHWLTRGKRNMRWRLLEKPGPNDFLVELPIHENLRRAHPELPQVLRARLIRYQRRGLRPHFLLTSLLDPVAFPATEILELYHQRWELELGFDEIKIHILEREQAHLRSRAPQRVRQELWGLAISYNLVRLEMERVAEGAGVSPRRISYRHTLMLIRNFWITAWVASPGVLPQRLDAVHHELALLIIPPRRERRFPRTVKIKMSNYAHSTDYAEKDAVLSIWHCALFHSRMGQRMKKVSAGLSRFQRANCFERRRRLTRS
jgi:Transposase DDE domain/Insertion element 4 transposase N-terminal